MKLTLVLMSFSQTDSGPQCTLIDTAPLRAQYHLPVSILRRLLSPYLPKPFVPAALSRDATAFSSSSLKHPLNVFSPYLFHHWMQPLFFNSYFFTVKLMHFVDHVQQWARQLQSNHSELVNWMKLFHCVISSQSIDAFKWIKKKHSTVPVEKKKKSPFCCSVKCTFR